MWYFKPSDIRNIHFEISNFCNAACPECPRELRRNESYHKDYFNTDFLPLDLIKERINRQIVPHLHSVNMCGCWGDPLTHPNLVEICDYLVTEFPNITLQIHSNGGLRQADYYVELEKVLRPAYDYRFVWGLDGLADTNEIYRVGVEWQRVVENYQAFNQAGGKSIWQFIVFPWNQHQIDAAKEQAKKEKFIEFHLKISFRDQKVKDSLPKEFQHNKNETSKYEQKSSHTSIKYSKWLGQPSKGFDNFDIETKLQVKCLSQKRHGIFIMANGTMWPCNELGNPEGWQVDIEKATNARQRNSLHEYSMESIFKSKYWTTIFGSHKHSMFNSQCINTCGILPNSNVTAGKDQDFITTL